MLGEIRKIVELTSVENIDFITLKEEKDGLMCLFFSGNGTFDALLISKEPLISELKSYAIANIVYGDQVTKLLKRWCSWIEA